MHREFRIYISESLDPKVNLALEEWLMDASSPEEVVLFLWQNENTIVIGRNQNPYKECDIKKLREDNVRLIRRLSGGGAVFHDTGNLNFTFIASDGNYDVEQNIRIILDGVSRFGVCGSFNGRNDLLFQERKFSGNAFFKDREMNCHHGTLLVDVDLDKLSRYLTVSPLKLQSKGIDSVVSRVVNLKKLNPLITVEGLKDAIIESFNEHYDVNAQITVLNENSLGSANYINKYGSWEWNYSESPDFSIILEEKFHWGLFEIHLEVSDGNIRGCRIFTDALILEDFKNLENVFLNKEFKSRNLLESIEKCIKDECIKKDICRMVEDKFPERCQPHQI